MSDEFEWGSPSLQPIAIEVTNKRTRVQCARRAVVLKRERLTGYRVMGYSSTHSDIRAEQNLNMVSLMLCALISKYS